MVNCNPETVSTDYDTSDRLYFEPLTPEDVLEIIDTERSNGTLHGVIVQFGGQTPLKLAEALEKADVPILGTSPDAIDLAEDRDRFKQLLDKLKLRQPRERHRRLARTGARAIAGEIGYPIVIRPSYVLGGRAMEIVRDERAARPLSSRRLAGDSRPADRSWSVLGKSPLLIDRYLSDATEVDVDCLADGKDTFIAGIMEHIEEAGIHSGDSACSLPPHSLERQDDRRTGAPDPRAGARAQGRRADERAIRHQGRRHLRAGGESARLAHRAVRRQGDRPAGRQDRGARHGGRKARVLQAEADRGSEHVGVKEAVFPFARFPGVDTVLGPEMKSTGEVMGLDRAFDIAFAKSQLGGGTRLPRSRHRVRLGARRRQAAHSRRRQAAGQARLQGDRHVAEPSATWPEQASRPTKVNKVLEGRPHIVDAIKNGGVQLVFNTTEGADGPGRQPFAAARRPLA